MEIKRKSDKISDSSASALHARVYALRANEKRANLNKHFNDVILNRAAFGST